MARGDFNIRGRRYSRQRCEIDRRAAASVRRSADGK